MIDARPLSPDEASDLLLRLDELEGAPVPHKVRMSGHEQTLLDYVLALLTKIPEDEVRCAVAEGRFLDEGGAVLQEDSVLRFAQVIQVQLERAVADDPFLPTPKRALRFIFEDEHLIVVDKPPGLLSYPIGPRRLSALSIARRQLELRGLDGELRPLHRIDRETSGLLLMARQLAADRVMKQAFKDRRVQKSYLALVRGSLTQDEQVIDAAIGPDEGGPIRIKMAVRSDGKPARTRLRVLQRFGAKDWGAAGRGYTWVEAVPLTGRTHQIRLHLAHLGHPLVGDKIYSDGGLAFLRRWDGQMDETDLARLELPRHALHALDLRFDHPVTEEGVVLRAPVPQDLVTFMEERGAQTPLVRADGDVADRRLGE